MSASKQLGKTSTEMSTETSTGEPCPKCGAAIPVVELEARWCDNCNWGLVLPETQWWAMYGTSKFIANRLKKSQIRMQAAIAEDPLVIERRSATDSVAYLVCVLVIVGLLAVIALGAWITVHFWITPLAIFGFCAALGALTPFAWIFVSVKGVVSREELPQLAHLCDQVAQQVGAPKVSQFRIVPGFEFAISHQLRQKSVTLYIGLAMWEALTSEQQLTILGHEFGHLVNRHLGYRKLPGTAMRALDSLQRLLATPGTLQSDFVTLAASWVMTILRLGPAALLTLLTIPRMRSCQQAEYRCDISGVQVAGTKASLSSFHVLEMSTSWDALVDRFRRQPWKGDPYDEFARLAQGSSDRERLRRIRVSELSESTVDLTHPSTFRRRALVAGWPFCHPQLIQTDSQRRALSVELSPYFAEAVRELWNGSDDKPIRISLK
jgi:heat shock protein HtpX